MEKNYKTALKSVPQILSNGHLKKIVGQLIYYGVTTLHHLRCQTDRMVVHVPTRQDCVTVYVRAELYPKTLGMVTKGDCWALAQVCAVLSDLLVCKCIHLKIIITCLRKDDN